MASISANSTLPFLHDVILHGFDELHPVVILPIRFPVASVLADFVVSASANSTSSFFMTSMSFIPLLSFRFVSQKKIPKSNLRVLLKYSAPHSSLVFIWFVDNRKRNFDFLLWINYFINIPLCLFPIFMLMVLISNIIFRCSVSFVHLNTFISPHRIFSFRHSIILFSKRWKNISISKLSLVHLSKYKHIENSLLHWSSQKFLLPSLNYLFSQKWRVWKIWLYLNKNNLDGLQQSRTIC